MLYGPLNNSTRQLGETENLDGGAGNVGPVNREGRAGKATKNRPMKIARTDIVLEYGQDIGRSDLAVSATKVSIEQGMAQALYVTGMAGGQFVDEDTNWLVNGHVIRESCQLQRLVALQIGEAVCVCQAKGR